MAMTPERSKPPLHNFSLPYLKWGTQRYLRCMKVASAGQFSSPNRRSSPSHPQIEPLIPQSRALENPRSSEPAIRREGEQDSFEAVREKLTSDLRIAADKIRVSVLEEAAEGEQAAGAARPWNLRTRRAACTAPAADEAKAKLSPSRVEDSRGEKRERAKFSVELSREEIEDDFAAMAGKRPPRRPKKRPRNVQKQLDMVFPGLWLEEVTEDSYRVPELVESGKA